jgi:hypothetical protein
MIGITVAVVHSASANSFQKWFSYIISRKTGKAREFRAVLQKGAQQLLRTEHYCIILCDEASA